MYFPGSPVGHARRTAHDDAALGDGRAELLAEAALAHAGLAGDADDLALALTGPGQRVLEDGQLLVTPDQPADVLAARRAEPGVEPFQRVDPQRIPDTLDRGGPEVGEAERALHEAGGVLREVRPPRLGDGLHALGETDGGADGVEAEILADPADHRLTGVETEADVEDQAPGVEQLVGVAGDGLDQVQGGEAGPAGVVFQGDGCAEEGHDPVAGELVDHAVVAAHTVGQHVPTGEQHAVAGPELHVAVGQAAVGRRGGADAGTGDIGRRHRLTERQRRQPGEEELGEDDEGPHPAPARPHQRRPAGDEEDQPAGQRQEAGDRHGVGAGLGQVRWPDPDADGEEEQAGGGLEGAPADGERLLEQEEQPGQKAGDRHDAHDLPEDRAVPGHDEKQPGAGGDDGARRRPGQAGG